MDKHEIINASAVAGGAIDSVGRMVIDAQSAKSIRALGRRCQKFPEMRTGRRRSGATWTGFRTALITQTRTGTGRRRRQR